MVRHTIVHRTKSQNTATVCFFWFHPFVLSSHRAATCSSGELFIRNPVRCSGTKDSSHFMLILLKGFPLLCAVLRSQSSKRPETCAVLQILVLLRYCPYERCPSVSQRNSCLPARASQEGGSPCAFVHVILFCQPVYGHVGEPLHWCRL